MWIFETNPGCKMPASVKAIPNTEPEKASAVLRADRVLEIDLFSWYEKVRSAKNSLWEKIRTELSAHAQVEKRIFTLQ